MTDMATAEWDALKRQAHTLGASTDKETWVLFDNSDSTWLRAEDGWTDDLLMAGLYPQAQVERIADDNRSFEAMSLANALAKGWVKHRRFDQGQVGYYLRQKGSR